jgi:orotidine-5'-phosphate decarboxylase
MATISTKDRVIVALDCDADQARVLADMLTGHARWLKVGMTLYYSEGPAIVQELRAKGFKVFVDLKLHDIPHQVGGAATALVQAGADMLTVHASGGQDMMMAAFDAVAQNALSRTSRPIVLGITVLTSTDTLMLRDIGVTKSMEEQVVSLAMLTTRAHIDGVVCSPQEAATLRELLGPDAVIVTPGVRPRGSAKGDQIRVATPSDALNSGADYLVIGRPITAAPNPVEAFDAIVQEMEEVLV